MMEFIKIILMSIAITIMLVFAFARYHQMVLFYFIKKDNKTLFIDGMYFCLKEYGWFYCKCYIYKNGKIIYQSSATRSVELIDKGTKESIHDFYNKTLDEYKVYIKSWGLDD